MATQINTDGMKTFTAGEALAVYRRVKLYSSDPTQVVYADSDDVGIGVTEEAAASGATVTVRMYNHPGTFKVTCGAATDAGDVLYGYDDGKVDDVSTTGGPALFEAIEAGSGGGSIIEAIPIQKGSRELYAIVADGTTLTNTVTETALCTRTIDGGILRAGDVIEVVFRGYVASDNGTDTLTCKLYLGTEEIVTTGAVDVATGDVSYIHAFITIRTTGGSGTISASGLIGEGVPGTVTAKPWRLNGATEDISGDFALAVKGTWSAASTSNQVYAEDFIVLLHRQ